MLCKGNEEINSRNTFLLSFSKSKEWNLRTEMSHFEMINVSGQPTSLKTSRKFFLLGYHEFPCRMAEKRCVKIKFSQIKYLNLVTEVHKSIDIFVQKFTNFFYI